MIDLEPATRQMAEVIAGVPEGSLDGPTPCAAYTVGDLLEHIGTLTVVFAAAAAKESWEIGLRPPSGDASRLPDDWRTRIPRDLSALAEAWRNPSAWTGMTRAGGIDLPGDMAGVIVTDELVVHAWDLARATDQSYEPDPAMLEVALQFVSRFAEPGQEIGRKALFGPIVPVPDDAPLLDRVLGLAGRDPAWTPAAA